MRTPAKRAAYDAAYRAANKDHIAAKNAAYRAANKDKMNAKGAAYYAANKDNRAANGVAYRAANKAKIAALKAAYNAANKDKIAALKAAETMNLSDVYVRGLITKRSGIPRTDIPAELVEVKRLHLRIKRALMEPGN